MYPIKKGFALVEYIDGFICNKAFERLIVRSHMEACKVKNIDKIERRTGYDINGDGLIAQNDLDEFFDNMISDTLV